MVDQKKVLFRTVVFLLFFLVIINAPSYAKSKPKLKPNKVQTVTGKSFSVRVKGMSDGQRAKWKLSGDGILKKVSSTKKSIRLKAVKVGNTKVKAKAGKKTLTCKVSVSAKTQSYDKFDDFANALSGLTRSHTVQNSAAIAANDPYYTGRLVAKGKTGKIDFSGYNPQTILKSEDNIYILQFNTSSEAKNAFQEISNRKDIEWAESDQYIGTSSVSVSSQVASDSMSWGVSRMGADEYAKKTSKESITVAVVDTGVSSHPFLSGRIVSGYDYIDNDSDPADLNSHGTHVSGTIVDCTPGLNVKIMPVRVLDASGSGNTTTIAIGIRYAVDHGAKVINLSLGGGHSSYLDSYIQYAVDHGVTVVAAAGNNYSNTSSFCPAHLMNIIVVSAIDDSEMRAYFSNYGNSVDIAAPGVDIVSCVPGGGYASYDGTSMATPHISGAAAMVILNNPGITPAEVENKLKSCARDLGTSGWDMYYGYGIPDLTKIDSVSPIPTPTAAPTSTPTPTAAPTTAPTYVPTVAPTGTPKPTAKPTVAPTGTPIPTATPKPYPVIKEDDYEYVVQSDLTVLIKKYVGTDSSITIPTQLGGYPVAGICDSAFRGNKRIRYVQIDGIIGIGAYAFADCPALENIDYYGIINGIGTRAFANCTALRTIAFWGIVNQSSSDIFAGCTGLSTADIYGIVDQSVTSAIKNSPSNVHINMYG